MRRYFGSVRAQATLGATLVVAVALIAAGTGVLMALRINLTDQASSQAETTASRVISQLASGTAYADLDLPDVFDEGRVVQVVDEAGRVVAASQGLERISGTASPEVGPGQGRSEAPGNGGTPGNTRPPDEGENDGDDDGDGDGDDDVEHERDPVELSDEPAFSGGSATVHGESAEYRFAELAAELPQRGEVRVFAGAPLSAERSAVGTVTTAMLIGFPLLLVVVSGVTWLVTRRALRPVEDIRQEMEAITASEDLRRRVPVPGTHDEVARLARTTNATLAALEESVERQRRFVADASHELRSPIASLRTQLEVGSAHPELLDVEGAVADTVRLQQLAADLLLLARLDAGERPGGTRLDLAALAREELSQRVGDRHPVAEDLDHAEVVGSRGQLARVLGNLVDNAQRHAAAGVRVSVGVREGRAVLAVGDDGAGVPEEERQRIFERFVRLDDARARDDGGAGLGLAIARDVAVRHGGTLTVRESAEGGALFELALPLAAAS
ncbi:HAMP domain-containing sensor histidine kinase [Streptomyces sp. NPDC002490]|uniref:sensor histidine kinase n=1 Tax=Streptomyces sp. NPDC002490 TaxID=3154416 RepID=UPI003324BF50